MSPANTTPSVDPLKAAFEAQVDRAPDRVAVAAGREHLRYGALDVRANELAHRLRALGAGPDALVAVALDRGPELVVALLAVLKAGAAYLPLDLSHPVDRLRDCLVDARAGLLIAQAPAAAALGEGLRCVSPETRGGTSDRLPDAAGPDHLAYVIYTSGSTGRPKGVAVTRHNVARLFTVTRPLFGFARDEVWTLCHSIAFDFSVWEVFGALLHGGRLVVVPREVAREPRSLAELVHGEGVTRLSQTPSAFQQLLPALLDRPGATALRSIVFGGEALDPASLRPWVARHGDETTALVNMYGITETTVHVTHRRLRARDLDGPGVIGRPLGDLSIELLDDQRRPVAAGEVGEIYVRGEGVARGYLHRPELTAERFVRLPGDERPAYRSGDLARMLPDGDLVYVGRADQQVKIRGHRIEPGEVRRALLERPEVVDAAVVTRPRGSARELVAYVVAPGGFSPSRLRAALARRLSEPMVPSVFVALDRLPLTENGKLDEAALPDPPGERSAAREPATEAERALCGCVARALEIDRASPDDRFVDLGGHSLAAAAVTRALELGHGLSLPIGALLSDDPLGALARRLTAPPPRPPLRDEPGDARASSAQLGIWLHAQRHADAAYHETLSLSIDGAVDADAVEAALTAVVARHRALRTTFAWRSGALWATARPSTPIRVERHDLASHPPAEHPGLALGLALAQASRPFDLAEGPLLRACLVRLGPTAHRLFVCVQHIACDAPSLHNLALELAALHEAHRRGEPAALPALDEAPVDEPAGGLVETAAPDLPSDLPHRADAPRESARQPLVVPAPLAAALGAVAASEGSTLFAVLLATWHALLHRYGAGVDARVATVVSLRDRAGLASRIGPLFRLVTIGAGARGDRPFVELLASVRGALLDALDARATEGSAETGFGLLPPAPTLPPGWRADLLEVGSGVARFDLFTLLQPQPDGSLVGHIEHRVAVRSEGFVARMAGHFVELLTSVAASPERPVGRLSMLPSAEREQLLRWGHGGEAAPYVSAPRRVLDQARRTPDALAVEGDLESLGYGELARRAEAIAAALAARGVGAEQRVAVLLDRSPTLVAALLGVLLAGGAFLALDPALPDERLARLLEAAGPSLALTDRALRPRLGTVPALCVEDCTDGVAPAEDPRPDALAYVIFTSGSSGAPKGVQIEHRSLANLVEVCRDAFTLGPSSRVLQLARVSFDVSVLEVFATLAAGATLVLGPDTPCAGEALSALLRERAITVSFLPASLLATVPATPLPRLATLVVGGEASAPETVDRWAPGRTLLNAYGPTEATVGATLARCEAGQGESPIGAPLAGCEVFVLDADGALVPVGVPGELHLGGVGLARGYLGQPGLTAACFVERSPRPGQVTRLYRTGDRVRWRADGRLDFLGRLDRQIKLRGVRIEPAEVESALRAHPAVREAFVLLRDGALCAYVVTSDDAAPDAAALRRFARERLPDAMVPSAVVRLDALPLTAHGKVDAAALPSPAPTRTPETPPAPAGSLEARIAALWGELLGVSSVGAHDSFFDLGGNSLRLVQMQLRLEAALGRPVPVAWLFQHVTPSALAGRLGSAPVGDAADATARAARFRERVAARRSDRGR